MDAPKLSPEQTAIVDLALEEGSYRSTAERDRKRCRTLNAKGLLRRDPKDGDLWYPSETASSLFGKVVSADAAVPATVGRAGTPQIATMIQSALSLFDEGDIERARIIADGAYDLSQAEARFAAKYEATRHLVPKLRQMQGDALFVETQCKIEVAKAYDAAQAAGQAATRGRPKNVPDGNIFTADEAGLSRKEIHEARKLAAAEAESPGIARRAIDARIAQGLAPTRASLRHAIGTRSATKEERGDNLYQTPPEAMHALLALEDFSPTVWEPACGRGAISGMLEAAGYAVVLSDVVDYATADASGELQAVIDFRETKRGDGECHDIVTNPPYGEVMNAFIAHALRVHKPRKMALLLNSNAYFGFEDPDRVFIMETCPPARRYAFSRRLPMMHRDGWDGPKASSQMNTEWFVWERQADGGYGDTTVSRRVDWANYMPRAAPESEAT
ncbi:SAM-dependent methyltransferase [Shinella zoogloeoides]|uniref:SAM-dependent methyltransferase n=1 Tax=Shinella zoogloeoides TaxID=352475 RepID=UPI001F59A05F|nr:SAM-dependent methyltransferase [Shinella zoogloeoides]